MPHCEPRSLIGCDPENRCSGDSRASSCLGWLGVSQLWSLLSMSASRFSPKSPKPEILNCPCLPPHPPKTLLQVGHMNVLPCGNFISTSSWELCPQRPIHGPVASGHAGRTFGLAAMFAGITVLIFALPKYLSTSHSLLLSPGVYRLLSESSL